MTWEPNTTGGDEASSGNDRGSLSRALHFNDVGRHDLAERALREGLRADPEDPALLGELGRTALLQDRYDAAEEAAREALSAAPRNVVALSVLGGALTGLGRHSEAEGVLLQALRDDPRHAGLLCQYGWLLQRVGRLEKAERVARAALASDPEHADAHRLLALVLAEARSHEASLDHGQRGLTLDPSQAEAHAAQGFALFQGGHPLRGRAHLREALRSNPSPQLEEAFHEIDRLCRLPGLPLYWWSRLVDPIPGKQITVWIAVIVLLQAGRFFAVPDGLLGGLAIAYIGFMIYTWIGFPLTGLWVKLFPAR